MRIIRNIENINFFKFYEAFCLDAGSDEHSRKIITR